MAPYAATRRNGICRGSLYKTHLSVATPPNLSNAKQFNGEMNERRSKSHDYCALIGNTLSSYPDVQSYYRGDFPTTEVRIVGASAWNPPARADSKKRSNSITGDRSGVSSSSSNPLSSLPSSSSSSSFRIVTYAGTHVYCSAPTLADRDTWLAALHSGLEASYALYHETLLPSSRHSNIHDDMNSEERKLHYSSLSSPSQRILTPPSKKSTSLLNSLNVKHCVSCGKPAKSYVQPSSNPYTSTTSIASSASSAFSTSNNNNKKEILYLSSTPLPQYGMECRADVCRSCLFSQGILSHVTSLVGLYASHAHERAALQAAQSMAMNAVEKALQEERDFILEQQAQQKAHNEILEQQKSSSFISLKKKDDEKYNSNADDTHLGGSWTTIASTDNSTASNTHSTAADSKHRNINGASNVSKVSNFSHQTQSNSNYEDSTFSPSLSKHLHVIADHNSSIKPSISSTSTTWLHVPPTDVGTKAISSLIQTPGFATFRRRSRALEVHCRRLELGSIAGAAEFLELLTDSASFAAAFTNKSRRQQQQSNSSQDIVSEELGVVGGRTVMDDISALKREAFKVAGDMNAAIKLLESHALPSARIGDATQFLMANEMLATIFEFLLDLCEDGELGAVAFFWPQLKHIHLRMLPAKDADALVRVELMEDFLLTVCSKYSVHLGLELVWGLIADLEESLEDPNASFACRSRKFSVMRFVCELESTLFGFEGGWGGGSLSLRGLLSPSDDQASLTRDAIAVLQLHRRYSGHHLTRSVRVEKLRFDAMQGFQSKVNADENAALKIDNKEQKATANFFSAQLEYARKLGDIAEKLRFMDVEKRSGALEKELELMNTGKLGGDPICRAGDGIASVVRLPYKEGHVFRSKERTPVLLLMEVLRPDSNENDMRETVQEKDDPIGTDEEGDNVQLLSADTAQANVAVKDAFVTPVSKNRPSVVASPRGRALIRLDSSAKDDSEGRPRLNTSDKEMEGLVAEAVKKQLHAHELPIAPDLCSETKVNKELEDAEKSDANAYTPEETTEQVTSESSSPKLTSMTRINSKKKMSALVSFGSSNDSQHGKPTSLSAYGDGRREVLTTILAQGMRGDTVAKGAAKAVQRTVQVMDREKAIKLIMAAGKNGVNNLTNMITPNQSKDNLTSKPGSLHGDDVSAPTEDDEAIDALRLLLIQNRVAQENLSPENAEKVLGLVTAPPETNDQLKSDNMKDIDMLGEGVIDAGEIDPRLSGCGPMSPAIVNAVKMWKNDVVSNAEVLELVQKDLQFLRHTVFSDTEMATKLIEDSAFWVRFAFGERWAEKKSRIAATSPFGSKPGWDLVGVIVKSNDDLRQEAFVMQLIELCQEAFENAGLELWVHPYRILATSSSTGIIETVRNAISFDGLKKRPGYGNGGLRGHLIRMTEFEPEPKEAFEGAQRNFVRSLAAYSLMSYLFMFKDRHNGNLLLDTAGHVIHIDFGFVFGIAPGGSFSLEMSTPFKLTEEMLEVMDGPASPLFSEFVTLFCCGFLALQTHVDTFCTVVEITCKGSNFKCFEGKNSSDIVEKMRKRFAPDLNKAETVAFALDLIKQATSSYGTKQYDFFQYLSQGIAA